MLSSIIFRIKWLLVGLTITAVLAFASGVNLTQLGTGVGKFFAAIIGFFVAIFHAILPNGGGHFHL